MASQLLLKFLEFAVHIILIFLHRKPLCLVWIQKQFLTVILLYLPFLNIKNIYFIWWYFSATVCTCRSIMMNKGCTCMRITQVATGPAFVDFYYREKFFVIFALLIMTIYHFCVSGVILEILLSGFQHNCNYLGNLTILIQ